MLQILIVDDEAPSRDELRFLLTRQNEVTIVGEADSGPTAVGMAAALQPDIVFLYIQLRGMDGFETAKAIREVAPCTQIVFATTHEKYCDSPAVSVAADIILKPFHPHRVRTSLERAKRRVKLCAAAKPAANFGC